MSEFDAVQTASIIKDQKTVKRHWVAMPILSAIVTAGADILCHKAALVGDISTLLILGSGFAVGGLLTWRAARAHKRLMKAQNPEKMELIEALKKEGIKTQSLEENALKTFTRTNLGLAAFSSLVGYWAPESWQAIPFLFSNSKTFDKGLVGGLSGVALLIAHTASYLSHKNLEYITSRSYEPLDRGVAKSFPSLGTPQGNSPTSPPTP